MIKYSHHSVIMLIALILAQESNDEQKNFSDFSAELNGNIRVT